MANNGSLGLALANPTNRSQTVAAALRVDGHTHMRPRGVVLVDGRAVQVDQMHLKLSQSLPPASAVIVRIDSFSIK